MKTTHTQVHPHENEPGSGLVRRIGAQVAALLIAVLAVPSAFHAGDTHPEPAQLLKRSVAPGLADDTGPTR